LPTYEYACRECGEHLEAHQSFSDPALTECPACGGPLRKVFGNIAITFKGSGFYKTDSRSTNGKGKPAKVSGEGSSSGSSSSEGSSGSSSSEGSSSTSSSGSESKSESSKSEKTAKPEKTGKSEKSGSSSPSAAAAS